MPEPKPNPLDLERRRRGSSLQDDDANVAPAVIGADASWRAEVVQASKQPETTAAPGAAASKPRLPKVDTAALTGLRGLAALHVALGHIFGMSTLRQDLIGGAAMPFFFLLSGFVMTLGYGQSAYAPASCCCGRRRAEADEDGDRAQTTKKKVMDKGKFWRNRFARLAPVYYFTNFAMGSEMILAGGYGINGTHQGVFGAILQVVCTLLGINSWLYPFIDVGMPLNGVTWTITTMSFFYLVFPWMLPPMQRMSPTARRRAIVVCFWMQAATYGALLNLYEYVIPVAQFIPEVDESGLQLGVWRAGLDYDYAPMYSYWVARAWPVTRVLVFAMGCLAALQRVEANKRQAQLDASGTDRMATATLAARHQDEQPLLLPPPQDAAELLPQYRGAELSGPSWWANCGASYLECDDGCNTERGCCRNERGEGCCSRCCRLKPQWLLSIPTLVTDRRDGGVQAEEMQRRWAERADACAVTYLVVVLSVVLVERFLVPLQYHQGRILLEFIVPGLELELIVALTYDGRRSWTARFCNWSPIQWFGNLSMSFYMVHMYGAFLLMGATVALREEVRGDNCAMGYVPGSGELACAGLGFPPAPGQYWLAISLVPELGEGAACAIAGAVGGVWPTCPDLPEGARYGEGCAFSGTVEAGDDSCTAYFDDGLSASYCPFDAATACIYGALDPSNIEGVGDGPDDLVTLDQYCTNCIEAWGTQFGLLDWYFIPLAVAAGAFMGWCLMRWVELPCQTWIRGDAWHWVGKVMCFPACCPFELACMPPWMPSCMPWECCPFVYTIFLCCFCGCFRSCREGSEPVNRRAYEPLPPVKP
jgi:peptidoglycan/LPS O-acetylase OafA/YrhL